MNEIEKDYANRMLFGRHWKVIRLFWRAGCILFIAAVVWLITLWLVR